MSQRRAWRNAVVEGVVIVGSILLAFGIDAWWDHRNDRRAELEYLRALKSEFEAAAVEIGSDERTRAQRLMHIDRLIGETKASQRPSRDSLVTWFGGLWKNSPYLPPDAVYQDLLATGGLNLLSSDELRRAILEYGQFTEKLRFFERRGQEFWDGALRPYLEQSVDILLVQGGGPSIEAPRPDLGPVVFAPGLDETLRDRKFQNYLLSRRTMTLDESRRALELARVIERIVNLIDLQLGS